MRSPNYRRWSHKALVQEIRILRKKRNLLKNELDRHKVFAAEQKTKQQRAFWQQQVERVADQLDRVESTEKLVSGLIAEHHSAAEAAAQI